jgi:hypothetical protein
MGLWPSVPEITLGGDLAKQYQAGAGMPQGVEVHVLVYAVLFADKGD